VASRNPRSCVDRDFGDPGSWEERWSRALRQQGEAVAARPASVHLVSAATGLEPGRALDAGCGHGAEARWLVVRGWRVTAVDFSETALRYARSATDAMGEGTAGRVDWVRADLSAWTPPPGEFDLVVCLHVHITGPVGEMVRRLAAGVAPGGTLLMVGYRPGEAAPGDQPPVTGQVQVTVEEARAALDPSEWEFLVAEERARSHGPAGVDEVIVARRTAAA